MSDDKRNKTDESTSDPVGGERLAEARRLKQISLPDIARQLHLDEPRVQALEENRFDALGAPVFAKGYLRKYAQLVGASIDDILSDYYTLNRATGAPPVVGPPRKRRLDIDLLPWLGGLLVVIVLAGLLIWWLNRGPAEPRTPAVETTVPRGETSVVLQPKAAAAEPAARPAADDSAPDDAPVRPPPPPADTAENDALNVPPPQTAEPQVEAPPSTRPAVATGAEIELQLTYSGDSWTEVTDASGRRLFFDLGRAGRTVNVRGSAPLRVLVGNEENVSLTVNGRAYAIAADNRRGNTARFTINN